MLGPVTGLQGGGAIAADDDGGIWIADNGNRRLIRFNATTGASVGTPLQYATASYTSTVSLSDPTRLFSNFLEYKINYSVPLTGAPDAFGSSASVPGAWTIFRESPIKIFSPSHTDLIVDPGVILVEAGEVCIGTKTTALQIGALQPAGKAMMPASAWINGVRLNPGEIFG